MNGLKSLFTPKVVAVIGASSDQQKVGGQIFKNACASGDIRAIPINPNHEQICGAKCFKSVVDYAGQIDKAIIAVKADVVPAILKEIGIKKIPYAVIISSGFKEKDRNGANLEKECLKIAETNHVRLLGPNCLGLLTPKVNLTFGPGVARCGSIGIISQSGAIGASLIDWIPREKVGINSFVSLGNKADLAENEFLEFYSKNRRVSSIFLYLESFKNGAIFFQIVSRLSPKKPIIILKPGITKNAVHAMTSHTGALITDAIAFQTAFSQSNLINAWSLEDFFYLMKYFSLFPHPLNNGAAIITNAGGVGVLLADLLPGVTPQDIGGAAKVDDYEKAFAALPKNLGILFCVMTPQEVTEIEKTAELISLWQKKANYPIFTVMPGGEKINEAREKLSRENCLVFDFPEDAVRIFKKVSNYYKNSKIPNSKLVPAKAGIYKTRKLDSRLRGNDRVVEQWSNEAMKQLDILDVQILAHEYSLPINDEYQGDNFVQCQTLAKKIGFPVVLKVHGEKLMHKTELNAVRLNIDTEKKLHEEYISLASCHPRPVIPYGVNSGGNPGFVITVSRQVPSSFEVIIGVKRDPDFGHLLMFGMGGIYTEIMKDLSYGLIPLSRLQITALIKKTKAFQIVSGARGLPRLDMKGIVSTIEKLNRLILENPWISELDINPLMVGEHSVKIVDLKIKS